jgi:hypothetical protein
MGLILAYIWKFLTLPDIVGDLKDELEALKARQIIARSEALVITQNWSIYV